MLRVALTGGIGSGKSTVANLFAQHEISIIDADKIAHKLTKTNQQLIHEIQQHFPECLITNEGELDRRKLRHIIFQRPQDKQWLEELLHPKIRHAMQQEINAASSPYCIVVIPLLTEAKQAINFIDRICVVDCIESLQIARASQRDQHSTSHMQNIIEQQSTREQRLALADDVIINEGSLNELEIQVNRLHQLYLELAQK